MRHDLRSQGQSFISQKQPFGGRYAAGGPPQSSRVTDGGGGVGGQASAQAENHGAARSLAPRPAPTVKGLGARDARGDGDVHGANHGGVLG